MPEMPAEGPCGHGPLLSALLDGELTYGERERVTLHLDRCGACQAEIADLRRVRGQLRSLPVREVPEELQACVTSVARRSGERADRRHSERLAIAGLLVAAAAVGALTWGVGPEPGRTVEVPVETFVNDHVVRTGAGPLLTPVVTQE